MHLADGDTLIETHVKLMVHSKSACGTLLTEYPVTQCRVHIDPTAVPLQGNDKPDANGGHVSLRLKNTSREGLSILWIELQKNVEIIGFTVNKMQYEEELAIERQWVCSTQRRIHEAKGTFSVKFRIYVEHSLITVRSITCACLNLSDTDTIVSFIVLLVLWDGTMRV